MAKLLEPVKGVRTYEHKGCEFLVRYESDEKPFRGKLGLDETWSIEIHDVGTENAVVASVIRKPCSYGYSYGLYELAFTKNGNFLNIFKDDWGDPVIGYLSEEEVLLWIDKLLDKYGDI